MNVDRRQFLRSSLMTSIFATGLARESAAQDFPARPIKWIVPFAPGGNYDITGRIVAEGLARQLNATVVVENRPGAGGVVGGEAAANAPADGHTLLMGSFNTLFVSPYMASRPSMVPLFAPIGLMTTVPMLVVTRKDGPFNDMRQVLEQARKAPGSISFGHAGNGTMNHITLMRLQLNEGVTFNTIPYKGTGPAMTDLLSGQLELYVDQLSTSLSQIRAGKLKALAALSLARVPQLPDVPDLKDIGCKPFDGGTTAGLFARAETPKPVITKLNQSLVAALKDPAVASKLTELGSVVSPTTVDEFTTYLKEQEVGIMALVKAGMFKPE